MVDPLETKLSLLNFTTGRLIYVAMRNILRGRRENLNTPIYLNEELVIHNEIRRSPISQD